MIDFTEDAAIMYMQEGMIHGELRALGLATQPVSRKVIVNNDVARRIMAERANDVVEHQGPALLEAIGHKVETILDIGCGLGLCSLSLYRNISPRPTLYLCDGGGQLEGDEATYCDSFTEGDNLVSDMRVTLDLLLRNGVAQEDINIVGPKAKNVANILEADLVVSNVSWFYHYPPEVYWWGVERCLHADSVMKVDIRVGPYSDSHPEYVDFLRERFDTVEELGVTGTPQRPDKTLSVLARHPNGK